MALSHHHGRVLDPQPSASSCRPERGARPGRAGRTRRRLGGEQSGSVIIELSLVAMLLLLFGSAAVDYGLAWQSGLTVNEAARAGARVASADGNTRGSDFEALKAVKAALVSSGRLDGVERIVIYQANSSAGRVPNGCKTGGGTNCQVITGAQFKTSWENSTVNGATTSNGCLRIASTTGWCPTSRVRGQANAQYYGVWIRYTQDNVFGLIGDQVSMEKWAVMRLEPQAD